MSGKVTWNHRPQASYVVYESRTRDAALIGSARNMPCVAAGPPDKNYRPSEKRKWQYFVTERYIELRASDGTRFKVKEEELKRSCKKVPCFDHQATRQIPLPADHLRILLQFAKGPP
ncbi:hypothetical protein FISHEDRAFT_56597 [Fistulina hepatica ATCC 64428]|uniref:Uncharacterized protein n=1 Tax=Fistulina hepatica ATCC 64428 TaxID=1128425 RepID=A0A0D7AIP1_9AGAR|nr:hypothetical protein FISHEDRAFT_56597 [Fistulina hepatica ATCC 64428]